MHCIRDFILFLIEISDFSWRLGGPGANGPLGLVRHGHPNGCYPGPNGDQPDMCVGPRTK